MSLCVNEDWEGLGDAQTIVSPHLPGHPDRGQAAWPTTTLPLSLEWTSLHGLLGEGGKALDRWHV